MVKSARNETCRHRAGRSRQRLEAQLLRWNAKLHQLSLVDPDGVVVGLGGVMDAIFEVLNGQILALNRVLHLILDLLHSLGLQGRVLHELMKLCLLLLQLFNFCLQFTGKHYVIDFSVFLDFGSEFVELILEVFPVHDHAIVFVAQLGQFLIQFDHFLLDGGKFAPVVFSAHLMLLELSQQRLQFVSFQSFFPEGFLEQVVVVAQFEDAFLVAFAFLVDAFDFVFVFFDQFEVVPGDFVVVVLQLCEGLFVVLHQFVDVQVFALLEFVNFYPQFEFEFFLHLVEFGLIVFLDVDELSVLVFFGVVLFLLVVLFHRFRFLDVFLLLVVQVFLQVLFLFLHILHAVFVVLVLFSFGVLSVFLDVHVGLFLLVLQKFQFLQEHFHLRVVAGLHLFAFGLLVQDVRHRFLDLELGVVVELLDHVPVHLDVVTLGLYLTHLLLEQLQVALQLRRDHLHELIVRLLLFLGPGFWWHTSNFKNYNFAHPRQHFNTSISLLKFLKFLHVQTVKQGIQTQLPDQYHINDL